MHVLILGAYGLIGRRIAAALAGRGHRVTGLGREARFFHAPGVERWITADIAQLLTADAWVPYLLGVDAVVNASGALQTGLRDDLPKLQRDAIRALIAACEAHPIGRFLQISAPGAACDAPTEFLRTKGEADDALRASAIDWVILKPALVLSAEAYGGTSLLRALAAFPVVQPIVLPDSRLQTIHVEDVAAATCRALTSPALSRQTFELAEPDTHSLLDTVLAYRNWLGFGAPKRVLRLPPFVAKAVSALADLAGRLGWRAPLRSTALEVMAGDVVANPEPWRRATGETFASLHDTLARLPATRQERSFARMELVFPALVIIFAVFWIATGIIALLAFDAAKAVLAPVTGAPLASLAVAGGAVLDIAIGAAMLMRRTFRPACVAAAILSTFYLLGGSILTPGLWSDPLGPMLKILPVIALASALAAYAEER